LSFIEGNILLHCVDLDCEPAVGPSQRPPVREFHSVGNTEVGIVNLSGISAKGSFREANQSYEQAAFLVKI
jgi:hypothetical protein